MYTVTGGATARPHMTSFTRTRAAGSGVGVGVANPAPKWPTRIPRRTPVTPTNDITGAHDSEGAAWVDWFLMMGIGVDIGGGLPSEDTGGELKEEMEVWCDGSRPLSRSRSAAQFIPCTFPRNWYLNLFHLEGSSFKMHFDHWLLSSLYPYVQN